MEGRRGRGKKRVDHKARLGEKVVCTSFIREVSNQVHKQHWVALYGRNVLGDLYLAGGSVMIDTVVRHGECLHISMTILRRQEESTREKEALESARLLRAHVIDDPSCRYLLCA